MCGSRKPAAPLAVLAAAALFLGCQQGANVDSSVLATYDGGEITVEEFDELLRRQAASGEPLPDLEGDWRRPLLQELALREIVAESAAAIETPALETQLRDATEEIYIAAFTQRLGWNALTATEEEIRTYYDENPEIFVDPEKLRLQHIFIRSEKGSATSAERQAARERLEAIREQIIDGADFAAMAKEHSDSADGPAGGWMILKSGAQAVRSFTDAMWALETDEVSEVVDTPAGFQLARLTARIPPVERPFEDVQQFVTRETLKVKRRSREEDYLAEKGPDHGLVIHHNRLEDPRIEEDTPLFELDGESFSVIDFLAKLPPEYLPHFFGQYQTYLPRVLEQTALGRVLLREAIAAGVPEDPSVKAEVETTVAQLRASAEVDRRLVLRSAEIPESELRDHYEQNQDRFETVRRRTISVIRLPPERESSLWLLLKKGEEIAEQIRGGADFAELAREHSQHVSAQDAGVLLTQTDDEIRLRVQGRNRGIRIINALEVGEVSNAFIGEVYDSHRLRYQATGVYVVRLDEDLPPRQAPYEEVEELVRGNYLRRFYTRFLTELREEMLDESGFRVVEANLPEQDA